jgi:hypothetical protein
VTAGRAVSARGCGAALVLPVLWRGCGATNIDIPVSLRCCERAREGANVGVTEQGGQDQARERVMDHSIAFLHHSIARNFTEPMKGQRESFRLRLGLGGTKRAAAQRRRLNCIISYELTCPSPPSSPSPCSSQTLSPLGDCEQLAVREGHA